MMPLQGAPSFDDKLLGRSSPLSENGPDPEKQDLVMLTRKRISRIYYKGHFFDYPVTMKWDTIKNMGFVTTVRAGLSYVWSAIFKKKEDNLENFYINRFGKVLYKMFFEGYTAKVWGRSPKEISADWGSQRVKGLSIRAMLKDIFGKLFHKKNRNVETSLIEEFWYPKYGPGQLWEYVAKRFTENGGTLVKNCKVVKIIEENSHITSLKVIMSGKEEEISGDVFISSMPIKDLVGGISNAPENVREVAKGLPYRDFVTVGLEVDKLKLVNKTKIKTLGNIVPDCWIYVQDSSVLLGRIQIFNNWSPYMVDDPENKIWLGLEYFCREGDEFWSMSDEDTVALAIKELCSIGVIDENAVSDSHVERVKKAYPAYFDTYSRIVEVKDYLLSIDNLYCVGRNGQHRYNNMDHSMLTAILTAKAVCGENVSKEEIWSVNTEKSYHEKK